MVITPSTSLILSEIMQFAIFQSQPSNLWKLLSLWNWERMTFAMQGKSTAEKIPPYSPRAAAIMRTAAPLRDGNNSTQKYITEETNHSMNKHYCGWISLQYNKPTRNKMIPYESLGIRSFGRWLKCIRILESCWCLNKQKDIYLILLTI